MSESFAGKVVLVTGGGRGMGRNIAETFSRLGAKIIIGARTIEYGHEAVKAIHEWGGEAIALQADNSDRASMKKLVMDGVAVFGQLDVVVHCAAHWVQGEVLDIAEDDFDLMIKSNIHSLYWLARDTAPFLSKAVDKGRLIYISSGAAGRQYIPGNICYSSTKAYMNEFARGLAMELGKKNILVNVIEPGLIVSDRVLTNISMDVAEALTTTYPIPRPGTPEDIANAVLFFASDKGAYITGASLLVDGGSSMSPMPDLEKILAGP